VGHAADGSPLIPPARLCKPAGNGNGRQPADTPEGKKP
jgi:hypothetical protein